MAAVLRVFALGGSILAPDQPDLRYAETFAALIEELLARGEKALVVTGGGAPARRYIRAAREGGVSEETLDLLGIDATRLNARFLLSILARRLEAQLPTDVPHRVEDAARMAEGHAVVVMGGTVPGHSTDYVAARLAAAVGADHLYVLTNVDGVYTADPKTDPEAKRLPELDSARLLEIVGDPTWTAGRAGVVDPACARLVHEARLPVTVLDGRDLDALRRDLAGEGPAGSRVLPVARP